MIIKQLFKLFIMAIGLCIIQLPLQAAPPEATEVNVVVGSSSGELRFFPSELAFERGKYYKLLIHNPSSESHYFTSDGLATHVFTRKVEVLDESGETLVEIHGAVNDMELNPGTTVAWYFYPMTNSQNLRLYCHKKGHEDAGMVGNIQISGPPPFSN